MAKKSIVGGKKNKKSPRIKLRAEPIVKNNVGECNCGAFSALAANGFADRYDPESHSEDCGMRQILISGTDKW